MAASATPLRPLERLSEGAWGSACGRLLFMKHVPRGDGWRVFPWKDEARGELGLVCDYQQLMSQRSPP